MLIPAFGQFADDPAPGLDSEPLQARDVERRQWSLLRQVNVPLWPLAVARFCVTPQGEQGSA